MAQPPPYRRRIGGDELGSLRAMKRCNASMRRDKLSDNSSGAEFGGA
jgi:hypothetical protein